MSEFKGTPGPWEVVNGTDIFTPLAARNGAGTAAHEKDGWHIADCSMGETQTEDGTENIPHREQLANARLIASAPELLEACQKFSAMYGALWDTVDPEGGGLLSHESVKKYDDVHEEMSAAIAKATGGAA